jgi:molybdopterin converting factor small subunit
MATLRLFANLRETAGTDTVEIDASTVGELLDSATEQFGDGFATGLRSAGVWVNGETAGTATPLSTSDEVAVIPPVSGGTLASRDIEVAPSLLSVALVVALLAVAWAPIEWFVVVAVGSILAWVWDAWLAAKMTANPFVVYPPLLTATMGGAFAYTWGIEGVAGAMAAGVILSVSWPVFDKASRDFRITASTTLVSVVVVAASGALVLTRLYGSFAVVAFVVVAIAALIGAWLAGTYGSAIQSVDANVGALLGALLAGLGTGLVIEELDIAAGLLGGVAAAAGVIAGRALGSMLRTGTVTHTEDAPGSLALFDGVIIAAPLFWLTLWVFG